MADFESGTKTEPGSPRKREKARQQGVFARSADLNSALIFIAGLLALAGWGPGLFEALLGMMRSWMGSLNGSSALRDVMLERGLATFAPVGISILLVVATVTVSAVGAGALQAGLRCDFELLLPNWERVGLIQGLSRMFSLPTLMNSLFGLFKLGALSWVAYRILAALVPHAPTLWQLPVIELISFVSGEVFKLGWSVAVPMLFLAGGDYAFRWWKNEQDLMMSREEAKEESKQEDVDPQIKARIREVQRTLSRQRMMRDVPKATVVITNPTHVAVALRYEPGVSDAPVVIAKGENKMAERIKALAYENDIPVIEEPPLARALLRSVEVGQEIRVEFYRAVAEILALLHRRRKPVTGVWTGSKA